MQTPGLPPFVSPLAAHRPLAAPGRGPHCAPSSILRWAGAPGHCLQELGCLRLQPHALYPELGPSLPKVNLGGEQVASLSGAQCLPLGWGAPQGCCRCRENTGGCCRQCHCHPVGFPVIQRLGNLGDAACEPTVLARESGRRAAQGHPPGPLPEEEVPRVTACGRGLLQAVCPEVPVPDTRSHWQGSGSGSGQQGPAVGVTWACFPGEAKGLQL